MTSCPLCAPVRAALALRPSTPSRSASVARGSVAGASRRRGSRKALAAPAVPAERPAGTRQRCALCGRWCRSWWTVAGLVYGVQCARYLWVGLPRRGVDLVA